MEPHSLTSLPLRLPVMRPVEGGSAAIAVVRGRLRSGSYVPKAEVRLPG